MGSLFLPPPRAAPCRLSESKQLTHFTDLGLAEVLLRALQHEGYQSPTPIQAKAIPSLLQGRDLLGIAQTGTGKTAAFSLPIIQRLITDKRPRVAKQTRVLVLAPTRELAVQIGDSFKAYGRFARLSVAVVVGGMSMRAQTQALAPGVDVLVATPGRLIDLVQQGLAMLNAVEVLVLDEADHMLDLGFIIPIRKIISKTPKSRQSLFFSATMPKEIAGLAGEMLRDPVQVSVAPVATTAERVSQKVILCDTSAKRAILVELLSQSDFKRTIVFTRTKRGADKVAAHLEANGQTASAIHGNKSQNQRQRALEEFRSGKIGVLVATDIAARGIDIDNVSHVVNYELPDVPEAYVHRIGRTARAGAEGAAVSLCDSGERDQLRAIEKLTRQTIPSVDRRGDPSAEVAEKRGAPAQRKPMHKSPRPAGSSQDQGRGQDQARGSDQGRAQDAGRPHDRGSEKARSFHNGRPASNENGRPQLRGQAGKPSGQAGKPFGQAGKPNGQRAPRRSGV